MAIAVISFALVVILSALNGFESLLGNLYSNFDPQLKIESNTGKVFLPQVAKHKKLVKLKFVEAVFPSIEENAVIMHGEHKVIATVKAIDPQQAKLLEMEKYIVAGTMDLESNGRPIAVLGAGIDQKLTSNVDDPYGVLTLYTPRRGNYSTKDPDAVNEMKINPGGVLLMDQIINEKYVLVPLDFGRELFEYEEEVGALEVFLKPKVDIKDAQMEIQELLGNGFTVKNRKEQQSSIFAMFKNEKRSTFFVLLLILVIALFNLVGALTMMVIEKRKDLKVFAALGAQRETIKAIYYSEGILISLFGALFGAGLGVLAVWLQERYHFVVLDNSILPYYPVNLQWGDVGLVLVITVVLGMITSIYPAKMAARELST